MKNIIITAVLLLIASFAYGQTIADGYYDADVGYYNPDTGYSTTYTLEVEVEDGYLTTIYFPSGGRLDDSHIYPGELDDSGYVVVYDDEDREFEVQIWY